METHPHHHTLSTQSDISTNSGNFIAHLTAVLRFIIECATTEEDVLGLTFYMELYMIIIMQALVASVGDTCSNGLIIVCPKKSCLRIMHA